MADVPNVNDALLRGRDAEVADRNARTDRGILWSNMERRHPDGAVPLCLAKQLDVRNVNFDVGKSIFDGKVDGKQRTMANVTACVDLAACVYANDKKTHAKLFDKVLDKDEEQYDEQWIATFVVSALGLVRALDEAGAKVILCGEGQPLGRRHLTAERLVFRIVTELKLAKTCVIPGAKGEAVAVMVAKELRRREGDDALIYFVSPDTRDAAWLAGDATAFNFRGGAPGVDALLAAGAVRQPKLQRYVYRGRDGGLLTGDALLFIGIVSLSEENYEDDGLENPCLLEKYVELGHKLARREAITNRNLSLLRDVFRPERVERVDNFLQLYDGLLVAGHDPIKLVRDEVRRLHELQRGPGRVDVDHKLPPWFFDADANFAPDTIALWFCDELVQCLSKRGVDLTFKYIEDELRSRQAAQSSAPHQRFDPLGPPANTPAIAALLRECIPIRLKCDLDAIAQHIYDSAKRRYDQYDQNKFHKAARRPPPQQSVQQGGVDAEEVDPNVLAELEAGGDDAAKAAAELREQLRLHEETRPRPDQPARPPKTPSVLDLLGGTVRERPPRGGATVAAPTSAPDESDDESDAEPWDCPACTYRNELAEAGFLACAMCGRSKDD